jgi:hypothetical protein
LKGENQGIGGIARLLTKWLSHILLNLDSMGIPLGCDVSPFLCRFFVDKPCLTAFDHVSLSDWYLGARFPGRALLCMITPGLLKERDWTDGLKLIAFGIWRFPSFQVSTSSVVCSQDHSGFRVLRPRTRGDSQETRFGILWFCSLSCVSLSADDWIQISRS